MTASAPAATSPAHPARDVAPEGESFRTVRVGASLRLSPDGPRGAAVQALGPLATPREFRLSARAALTGLVLAAVAGCVAPSGSPAPVAAPNVRLVDSIPWEHVLAEGVLHRVEVRSAGRTDTIPGALTTGLPVHAGAGRLLGFTYEMDEVRGIYEYDARRRRTRLHPLPSDLNPVFSAPALAPDGRHVAYVVLGDDVTAWAVVRGWPDGRMVWRSDAVEIPATDHAGGNIVRWISPDTARVLIETGHATGNTWYRVVGSVRERRVLVADSMPQAGGIDR
jgi:hypothetical protein